MLLNDLRTLILSATPVTSLIAQRVTVGARNQGVRQPDVALLLVSLVPNYHLQGDSGLDNVLVQLDIRSSRSMEEADTIAAAIRAVLSGYEGTVGATTFYGIFLRQVRQRVDEAEGGGLGYQVQMDWDIHCR